MKIFVAHWDRAVAFVVGFTIGTLAAAGGAQACKVISPLATGVFSWPGCAIWTILLLRREIGGAIRRLRRFEIGDDGHIEGTMEASTGTDESYIADAPITLRASETEQVADGAHVEQSAM